MTGILLCRDAPEVTESEGLFLVELDSGGEHITLALTQRAICILAERSMQAVDALARRRKASVVPFPTPKPARGGQRRKGGA
jgi:hypothetical protein